jgi:hypothetical protein
VEYFDTDSGKRQRRELSQPGPKAQEQRIHMKKGLKARSIKGITNHKSGLQPLNPLCPFTQPDGLGWYKAGPLALLN